MYHIIQSYPVGIIQIYIRFCYFSCKIKHVIDFSLYNTNVIIDFCDGILVRDTLKYFLIIFFSKNVGRKVVFGVYLKYSFTPSTRYEKTRYVTEVSGGGTIYVSGTIYAGRYY